MIVSDGMWNAILCNLLHNGMDSIKNVKGHVFLSFQVHSDLFKVYSNQDKDYGSYWIFLRIDLPPTVKFTNTRLRKVLSLTGP